MSETVQSENRNMKDEYGNMSNDGNTFIISSFELESGVILRQAEVNRNQKLNLINDNNEIV